MTPARAGPTVFRCADSRIGFFKPITKPASLFVIGEGGTTFGSTGNGYPQFFLGGSNRLSAYGTNELFGDQYYFFRAGYLHDLLTLPPLAGKKVYAIAAYEFGKMYGFPNASRFPNDFAARRPGRDRRWTLWSSEEASATADIANGSSNWDGYFDLMARPAGDRETVTLNRQPSGPNCLEFADKGQQ